jgi:hypothetical protein
MMRVWVLHGSYEAEYFTSVHLTEKGCALAAIADVLDFLGIDGDEEALRVMNDCHTHSGVDEQMTVAYEWDHDRLKSMTRKQLWKIFADWTEIAWDHMADRSYYIDATPQLLQA